MHSFLGKDHYHGVGVLTLELIQQLEGRHEISVIERSFGENYGVSRRRFRGVNIYTVTSPANENGMLINHVYKNDNILDLLDEVLLEENGCHLVNIHHMISWPTNVVEYFKSKNIPIVLSIHDTWYACPAIHYYNEYYSRVCDKPTRLETKNNCEMCLKKQSIDTYEKDMPLHWFSENIIKPRGIYNQLLSSVDAVVYPTKKYKKLYEAEGFAHSSAHVIPYFLRTPAITKRKNEYYTFGFISNLSYGKGADLLLSAFNSIQNPNVRLRMYGAVYDQRTKLYLDEIMARDSRISYHGSYDFAAVNDILSEIDCVVVPSIYLESFNLCSYASVNSGTPLVVSDTAYHREFLKNGTNCSVFKSGDSESLRATIDATYQKKKDYCPTPFRNDDESFGNQYHDLYMTLRRDIQNESNLCMVVVVDNYTEDAFEKIHSRLERLHVIATNPTWSAMDQILPMIAHSWGVTTGTDDTAWMELQNQTQDTVIVLSNATASLDNVIHSAKEFQTYEFDREWKKLDEGVFIVSKQFLAKNNAISEMRQSINS